MVYYCSLTGVPILEPPLFNGARVSLVHPEVEYLLSLPDKQATDYAKSVESGCYDVSCGQQLKRAEQAIRLLTYRFLNVNNRCAEGFRPVFLRNKSYAELPDLLLAVRALVQLYLMPKAKTRELPMVCHLDTNTPAALFFAIDGGLDTKVNDKLGDLLVYVSEKDRLQASLDTRVKTMVRVLVDTGVPVPIALDASSAWLCEQVVQRASASSAEFAEDSLTLMKETGIETLKREVYKGTTLYAYLETWVASAQYNAEVAGSPALRMVKFLLLHNQLLKARIKPVESVVFEDTPAPVVSKSVVKLKSNLKVK